MTDQHLAVEAERMVLSAMMHDGAEEATRYLTPSDFYEYRHALIYDHLLELWGAGEPTDPVALLKRLADRGELTRSDVGVYLHSLYELDASPLQVGYYARIVLDGAHRRSITVMSAELARVAELDDGDVRRAKVAEVLERSAAERTANGIRDSWAPVDLGPYLDGTYERPEPSIGLARRDGLRLLYPGKEHAVVGEMESGKSWFSLACVAAELLAGHTVVYIHFEEDDPADTVERLQVLGVPIGRIRECFLFVGPSRPATPENIKRLLAREPVLVVLDGQNEGMVLHAQAIREEDGAGKFRALLVKPWTAAGAAVLACDHVVKDKDARGRYALGSIHKGNALSGTLITLENSEPFGRAARGSSRVYVTKDRPGHLRQHGQPTKVPGKTFMGQLVVDDTRTWVQGVDLAFLAPTEDKPVGEKPRNPLGDWILEAIAAEPEQAVSSSRTLFALLRKAKIEARNTAVMDAVDDLVVEGRLVEVLGARNSKGYRIVTASPTASQDQQEVLL